jgi:hypothetical protein
MSLFRKDAPTATIPAPTITDQAPAAPGPAISLDKVPAGLVSLVKSAAVSLEKNQLTGQRAAVYLVLDHSGSMRRFYADGSVQRLAEQALGLSANLDDDGTVPMLFFADSAGRPVDVSLANYAGIVDREHRKADWGYTNYAAAIDAVVAHYEASGATDPAFVIFQTDGAPYLPGKDAARQAEIALKEASKLPLFFAFVGYGDSIQFLAKLDELRGRAVDNASFFHASNPLAVTDGQLYDGLTTEYAGWLAAASAAGIVR